MTTEPSPYLTVGQLRDLLAGWPDDRPVLVGTVAGEVRRVVYSCHENAEVTDVAGVFRTVARPPATYLEMPPPLAAPPGEFEALVLRGEVGGGDPEPYARVEMSAQRMVELLPAMRQLIAEGWTMSELVKPIAEGCGVPVRATFVLHGGERRAATP